MHDIKELITGRVREAYADLGVEVPDQIEFTEPPGPSIDLSSNAALLSASAVGIAPDKLAEGLARGIKLGDELERVEAAGPGFLNFYLNPQFLASGLHKVLDPSFGRGQAVTPERVNVEFSSANPTGPLTMGNARGGFVGDVIANTLKFLGNEVE